MAGKQRHPADALTKKKKRTHHSQYFCSTDHRKREADLGPERLHRAAASSTRILQSVRPHQLLADQKRSSHYSSHRHRLQARVHTQSKAYDLAIFSFKTAIRYATAAGDSNVHWIKATEAEAKKVKDLRDFESQAEERARERQMEQEFDAFVKGKYSDWQILGLQKPFANSPIDIKNGMFLFYTLLRFYSS